MEKIPEEKVVIYIKKVKQVVDEIFIRLYRNGEEDLEFRKLEGDSYSFSTVGAMGIWGAGSTQAWYEDAKCYRGFTSKENEIEVLNVLRGIEDQDDWIDKALESLRN